MPAPAPCIRCGADAVIPHVRVVDRGDANARQDMQVEVERRPNAILFKRPERSKVTARVCGACGHVELFADSPRALYTAYQQAEASPTVSAQEELESTREALADSQIRLHELEGKLAFVEKLLASGDAPPDEKG